jgi:hypothetical protein
MKFWIAPLAVATMAGVYETINLRQEWSLGGDHVSRASGTLLAYVLVGACVGLVISMFWSEKSE